MAYFHGFPGGPTELSLFGAAPDWASDAFIPDRSADRRDLSAASYFDDLADRALAHAGGQPLHLVAFSLGARVALEVAERLGSRVSHIDLVSPAGPLDGTDHLKLMAGKTVFSMAKSMPGVFALQTAAQGWIARNRPEILYRALFGAAGEKGLAAPGFQDRATRMLHDCFAQGNAGYIREVRAYVEPWSDVPTRVPTPALIWQGSADSWTPPQMAENLRVLLPHADLHAVSGAGHYGALHYALAGRGLI